MVKIMVNTMSMMIKMERIDRNSRFQIYPFPTEGVASF